MRAAPARPLIYHITHVDNLESIITAGGLLSDAAMAGRGGPSASIGLPLIKRRRQSLPVPCHPGTTVGEYVPFYFCPRSIMLYVIHVGNHPDLVYRGGQDPIVHIVADLRSVVDWAETNGVLWASSLSNAGARYVEYRCTMADLDDLDWAAIGANDFRRPEVKEAKQAEFLLNGMLTWQLVTSIGVRTTQVKVRVEQATAGADHRPQVILRRSWYY